MLPSSWRSLSASPFRHRHPFAIDGRGNLIASAGTVAGVLHYDAAKEAQTFSAADPYALGFRDAKGLAFDAKGRLFAVQAGELVELRPQAHSPRAEEPVAVLPGQLAPTALAIYQGPSFPSAYRGSAFIAVQNASRQSSSGDDHAVVFQPLANGKASGPAEVFARGFTAYRPSGLAIGPDGALFVSDSAQGRIWRITYGGDGDRQATPTTPTVR